MASNYDVTTKFKVDVTDLKKGIKEANNQIKLANSEFKAVSNGTKEWEHSLDGVSAKIKKTQAILDAQNKKLKIYEQELEKAKKYEEEAKKQTEELRKQLEKAKNVYGEDAQEVKKLEQELLKAEKQESQMKSKVESLTVTMNNQQGTINRTNAQLDNLQSELKDVGNEEKKVGNTTEQTTGKLGGFGKSLASAFGKTLLTGIATAGAAVVKFTKDAIKSYSEFEQVSGGVEKLFGKNADIVKNNALSAYKNQGLSANEYMENVTKFSASLISSLKGDTKKSADYANRALTDMSDNANTFGTDVEEVQRAYQGFAKGNFGMLDNLRLGFGGTKEEAQRLVQEASKMTDTQKKLGVTVDGSSLSFDNMINAISVMQDKMNISGTTAKESSKTIEGSINSMKSAWDNLLLSATTTELDTGQALANFKEAINNVISNLEPVIMTTLPTIVGLLGKIVTDLLPPLAEALLNGALQLINILIQSLPSLLNISTRPAVSTSFTLPV